MSDSIQNIPVYDETSYFKRIKWQDGGGEPLSADNLNRIEDLLQYLAEQPSSVIPSLIATVNDNIDVLNAHDKRIDDASTESKAQDERLQKNINTLNTNSVQIYKDQSTGFLYPASEYENANNVEFIIDCGGAT